MWSISGLVIQPAERRAGGCVMTAGREAKNTKARKTLQLSCLMFTPRRTRAEK
ncbi:MAG: hypothetical protein KGQ68_09425 [Gammaproteobacteria bacterium]|nr:hypothetical protein [Gammaproteobacteria bacterium]